MKSKEIRQAFIDDQAMCYIRFITKKGYKQNDILITKNCIALHKGDNLLITNNTRDLLLLGKGW